MDPLPYNITIYSQSAAILYDPSRIGGDIQLGSGWDVMYTYGTANTSTGAQQGVGDSYLQTTRFAASMSLTWVGTAAYVYGNSTNSSYTIDVDGSKIDTPVLENSLLASVTSLPYGNHTITLSHPGTDLLAIRYVVLTIGIGYEGSSFRVRIRSVPAVLDGQANRFFRFVKTAPVTGWALVPDGEEEILPDGRQRPVARSMAGTIASKTDPSLVFNVTNSSAFFLRGGVDGSGGPNVATLRPGLNGAPSKATVFNNLSPILDYDQVLYWESGLDRNQNYTVEIRSAEGSSSSNMMSFHTLDIIDEGPNPEPSQSNTSSAAIGPTGEPEPDRPELPAGSVAGITVGVVLAVIIITISALWWLRRRRRNRTLGVAEASGITPFAGTKSDYPRQKGSGQRPKENLNHETESEDTPPSLSLESNPPPSASVTHRALAHLRRLRSFATSAPIRETDAGPVTLPPEYDHSWAANANANAPTPAPAPAPAQASTIRALPIPPSTGPVPLPPNYKVEPIHWDQSKGPSAR
ncbi:hypothetical protein Moror_10564 [Moniliophthora roreri MCA 2997]|uniref:Uncharacterized protein n=1 Tax=Moniliophthora roreri (strain MCA 2997) TaxID=1381753 RepID=V2WY95_MONRO|nr:hypothetical protein Moror_10564 [Moniliophthora roreri MCA 2997]